MSERARRARSERFYFDHCRGQPDAALEIQPGVLRLVNDYWTV